ncbi:MAG: hypothetical protein M3383_03435 [Actinomycetota bacterium]|nr:hypothetical protein [Actinomycetota bacterium]
MYARVVRFTGLDADALETNLAGIRERSEGGPPEGVPAKALKILADKENGTMLAVSFFETEADMRTGDATLSEMTPPAGADAGTRASVDLCEVAIEREV